MSDVVDILLQQSATWSISGHPASKFRCSECKGYLNMPPIVQLPNGKSVCGRCIPLDTLKNPDGSVVRQVDFENLLRCYTFPCKNESAGCRKSIPFGEEEHEECLHHPFACPMNTCPWSGTTFDLVKHFTEVHGNKENSGRKNEFFAMDPKEMDRFTNQFRCGHCKDFLRRSSVLGLSTYNSLCGSCASLNPFNNPEGSAPNQGALEKILSKMSFPCVHEPVGCTKRVSFDDTDNHEQTCSFKVLYCPRNNNCQWKGTIDEIFPHLHQSHGVVMKRQLEFKIKLDENIKGFIVALIKGIFFFVKFVYRKDTTVLGYEVNSLFVQDASYKLWVFNSERKDTGFAIKRDNCYAYLCDGNYGENIKLDKYFSILDNPRYLIINFMMIFENIPGRVFFGSGYNAPGNGGRGGNGKDVGPRGASGFTTLGSSSGIGGCHIDVFGSTVSENGTLDNEDSPKGSSGFETPGSSSSGKCDRQIGVAGSIAFENAALGNEDSPKGSSGSETPGSSSPGKCDRQIGDSGSIASENAAFGIEASPKGSSGSETPGSSSPGKCDRQIGDSGSIASENAAFGIEASPKGSSGSETPGSSSPGKCDRQIGDSGSIASENAAFGIEASPKGSSGSETPGSSSPGKCDRQIGDSGSIASENAAFGIEASPKGSSGSETPGSSVSGKYDCQIGVSGSSAPENAAFGNEDSPKGSSGSVTPGTSSSGKCDRQIGVSGSSAPENAAFGNEASPKGSSGSETPGSSSSGKCDCPKEASGSTGTNSSSKRGGRKNTLGSTPSKNATPPGGPRRRPSNDFPICHFLRKTQRNKYKP